MAGTQSAHAGNVRLLGIPRSRRTVASIYPQYSTGSQGFPPASGQAATGRGRTHIHCVNVVRVRPRTSGSITDLLLALACMHLVADTAPQRSGVPSALGRPAGAPVGPPRGSHGGANPPARVPSGGGRGRTAARPIRRCETGASGRQRSHSLSESTRQITPPIRSGHAPPSAESGKSSQSVHPSSVLTW